MARSPKSITYAKIGAHRGRSRLWLEGRKLERAGIAPGERFSVTWDPETRLVSLEFGAEGDRVVSRRQRGGREMPIIDVSADAIEDALGEGIQRAKVTIGKGRITVEVHPDDAAAQERIDRLVSRIANGEPLETGSLAHGGGVLDHAIHTGLKDQGIKARLAFAVEIDDAILEAAASNNDVWDDDTIQIHGGMEEVDLPSLPKVDILVAGLPCVGASKSGKSKNKIATAEDHPTAGALFVAFLSIVKHTNPSIVILENVTDYRLSSSASVIRAALTTYGYQIHETVLEGNDFGALEDRRRLCMIAVSSKLTLDLDALVPTRNKEACLGDVLEDISPDAEIWRSYVYLIQKAERDKAAGKGFKMNLIGPEATRVGTIGAGYWKGRQTEPKVRHPDDPDLMRLLTPGEHAAVKTIPPELVSGLSWTLAHTILGNSVIWEAWRSVGRHVADRARQLALGDAVTVTPEDIQAIVAEQLNFSFESGPAPEPVQVPEDDELETESEADNGPRF